MGFTPLEGLVMGARAGDCDAGLAGSLTRHTELTVDQIDRLLNERSGLLGLSGRWSDMRDILTARERGEPRAELAVAVFCHRVRKYIGAYLAVLGGADAVLFSGGIGERAPQIRSRICEGMDWCGLRLDEGKNRGAIELSAGSATCISADGSALPVYVTAVDEETWIAREILVGELASFRQAALPLTAALGGAMLPAALYSAVNSSGPGAPGWGIPMATDIAFALGILSLLGSRVPLALKVFLTALAIADDLMAVLVIVLFYTSTISWGNLAIGGVFLVLLIAANMAGIRHPLVYSILGIGGLWLAFLLSGVHATVAGVIAAMTIPARTRLTGHEFLARGKDLLERFEKAMSPVKPQLANRERHQIANHMKTAVQHVETPLQQLEQALHHG